MRSMTSKGASVANQSCTNTNDGKTILTDADCSEVLGYAFSTWKKWRILIVIFCVQCSMNFNTSLYSNGLVGMSEEFGISLQTARTGAGVFLVTYAFGCELWAPWSEEFGRRWIMQISLLLVNLCCIPVALANNFPLIAIFRALGGLFSAGGSVTLGIVADMYTAETQQYAVAFVVFSSVGGSIFGPIVGGYVESHLNWRWCMWLQLIAGVVVQAMHYFLVDETRTTVLITNHAKDLRKADNTLNVYGPMEVKTWKETLAPKELVALWIRPFKMFFTEPIVAVLSLLSGFSDALIFMGFQSFGLVYKIWGFTPSQVGLTFIAIGLGYFLAYLSYIPAIKRNMNQRRQDPGNEFANYEGRMWWLMYTAPCLPIGLVMFAWTSNASLHWILPVIASGIIGIANYSVYMGTIDYLVASYGEFAASATGGNGFARDFLAGILTWAAIPFYEAFQEGTDQYLQWANTALAFISLLLVAATFWVYFKGPSLRARSSFAQRLADAESEKATIPPPNGRFEPLTV
ncbi:MFS multidrug transporter [Truncatella angustata]|uniref:MFS multidrug transporter n=1 Tax=Truncatella angustata TaxID=152316 RepID=A0A9P8UG42_9PEZI|nr:MFS multidrug transporter [Truncatella angustata]KAH6651515.1 MFS multidrug transporter [Truncatella angustata]